MALSSKHRQFIEQFLLTFNATEAYDQVYHPRSRDAAASNGYKLLRNAEIAEAIKHRLSETAMLADEVLMRLSAQARSDMNDFVRFNDDGDPLPDLQSAATFGKMPLVKKLKIKTRNYNEPRINPANGEIEYREVTETETEIDLYSSQAALKLLGTHHSLFDKRGSEEEPVHNVEWTVDQWREEQAKRQKQAAETMDLFDDDFDEPDGDE